ncbi:MAG: hypothetical protein NTU60_07635 [Candidatus Aminicenantes bacterium]|nr:hypothetical protein [Candidatus Aminicenantes bacterium]
MTRKQIFRRFLKGAEEVCFYLFLASIVAAQGVIDNPEKPLSAKAGRVLQLKEISRTTDEKGKFFFVEPWDVFTGKDGSVYVQEPKGFLKFDANGKFVTNLLKWGEGPGELNGGLTGAIVRENDIILYSSNTLKIVRIDPNGKLIEDKKFSKGPFGSLLGYHDGKFFMMKRVWEDRPKVSCLYEVKNRLIVVTEKEELTETSFLLPTTDSYYIRPGGRGAGSGMISRPMPLRESERYVYLFHTPEYLIKILDLEKNEISRSFRRKYERVRYAASGNIPEGYPLPKYYNDLCRLLWHQEKLWAVTSTFDKNKGILVDVFSQEGQYLDNFYLPLFKIRRNNCQYYAPMAIAGNFLYFLEANEEDVISLIKYEIVGE